MGFISENNEERIETTLGDLLIAIQESVAEEYGVVEEDNAHITKLVFERLMARYDTKQ